MNKTSKRSFKVIEICCTGRRVGSGIALFVAILFIVLAGPLYAEQICSDCHGAGPHGAGCSDASCGLSCHPNKLNNIKHPTGTGTPLAGDLSSADGIKAACSTCHIAPGSSHPFRINTEPDISGSGTNLDYACGQCHGGSGLPKPGIMHFDLTALSVYANGMHRGGNTAPTAAHLNPVEVITVLKGTPVSFTDRSTDAEDSTDKLRISANWGDGSVTTGSGGGVFTHTYAGTGVYNIVHTVTDSGGLYNSEVISVKVMLDPTAQTKITVNVKTGTAAISSARVYLRKGGVLKSSAYTNTSGIAIFSKLIPAADYTLQAYKSGVDFGAGKGKVGPVPAASADTTVADALIDINAVTP